MKYSPAQKIPLAIPNLCGNEAAYLQECVRDNFVSTVGPFVEKFESLIARNTNASYAVATCSGTSALHLALELVGVQADDLVVLPSFTFIASANAIKYTKADPWIFDISKEDWGLDAVLLEKTLESETQIIDGATRHKKTGQRVSAILVVWALAIPPRMDEISRIGKKYNIPVVVDAAGALGSKHKSRNIGELDAACSVLSFNGNKIVTSGGGGAIVTQSEALAKKAKHLSTTARLSPDYIHDEIGYNYRMTNIEAALGCAQIENLPGFILKKKEINAAYGKILQKFQQVEAFPCRSGDTSNYWLSGVLLPSKEVADKMVPYLNDNNIDVRHFWIPVHMQPKYKQYMRTAQTICESIYPRVLVLPSSTQITKDELDYVIDKVCDGLAAFGNR